MCSTESAVTNGVRHHCEGERLLRKAIGYDMAKTIRDADAPALRDALNHNPGKTQRGLIEPRLRRLEREAKQTVGSGYGWCGVGKR